MEGDGAIHISFSDLMSAVVGWNEGATCSLCFSTRNSNVHISHQ